MIIAGPCSAESERQVVDTAVSLAEKGITHFRAGVWKPRTKPGGFEGRGEEALAWLKKAREITGMKVFTEVATHRHVEMALDAGIDGLWLGARTTANPFAVQEIADALSSLPASCRKSLAVLVKNPVSPDLELWIGAIQRISAAGITDIAAIHRGFTPYGHSIYRNEPHWAIPIELRRRMPDLPVLCDPSHIGGKRELIGPLSRQAVDMGFDGLFVESHCNPDRALSDASQQVTPAELADIVASLQKRTHFESDENLDMLRRQIDSIDDQLLDILARRMAVAREIGQFKKRNNMSIVQPDRYNSLMDKRAAIAKELGLSPDFIKSILATIHEESVRQQL